MASYSVQIPELLMANFVVPAFKPPVEVTVAPWTVPEQVSLADVIAPTVIAGVPVNPPEVPVVF
jgi:hypothetical protein